MKVKDEFYFETTWMHFELLQIKEKFFKGTLCISASISACVWKMYCIDQICLIFNRFADKLELIYSSAYLLLLVYTHISFDCSFILNYLLYGFCLSNSRIFCPHIFILFTDFSVHFYRYMICWPHSNERMSNFEKTEFSLIFSSI